jgi:surfeit locus 1 family protein
VIGLAVLVSLGLWQLERRQWKEGLIAAIAARATAQPIPLSEASERIRSGLDVEYLRVRARGHFLNDKERFFYATDPVLGPGYHVYTPLEVAGGNAVLFVNRGFVPEALRAPGTREPGRVQGEAEVTGLLRVPRKKGFFVPDNDPAANMWYWPDLAGLVRSVFEGSAPPYVAAVLEAEAPAPGGWPRGGATRLVLPNRHLEYAITWFGLAVALLSVFVAFAATRLRSGPQP